MHDAGGRKKKVFFLLSFFFPLPFVLLPSIMMCVAVESVSYNRRIFKKERVYLPKHLQLYCIKRGLLACKRRLAGGWGSRAEEALLMCPLPNEDAASLATGCAGHTSQAARRGVPPAPDPFCLPGAHPCPRLLSPPSSSSFLAIDFKCRCNNTFWMDGKEAVMHGQYAPVSRWPWERRSQPLWFTQARAAANGGPPSGCLPAGFHLLTGARRGLSCLSR